MSSNKRVSSSKFGIDGTSITSGRSNYSAPNSARSTSSRSSLSSFFNSQPVKGARGKTRKTTSSTNKSKSTAKVSNAPSKNSHTSDSLESTFKLSKSNVQNIPHISHGPLQNVMENSAIKIQRWYRRHAARNKTSKAAVQRLLMEKKTAMERMRADPTTALPTSDIIQASEIERKKKREDKERKARQSAIEDLRRKREEKRLENQRKAEEELRFLEASGKVSKLKSKTTPNHHLPKSSSPRRSQNKSSDIIESGNEVNRPGTSASTSRKVDEIFQEGISSTTFDQGVSSTVSTAREPTENSTSASAKKTALDDLMETLKLLEEAPEELKHPKEDTTTRSNLSNWDRDHLEDDAGVGNYEDKVYLSAEQLYKLNSNNNRATGTLSDAKLQSILTYLDDIEKVDVATTSNKSLDPIETTAQDLQLPSARESNRDDDQYIESASAMASDVNAAILRQKLQLDEKSRAVEVLNQAIKEQQELSIKHTREQEKDLKRRLAIQRQEYETTIQRHVTFIDQLIDDKNTLSQKNEEIIQKLKEIDKKYYHKVKAMEERHASEINKLKEVTSAAEKMRREKWIEQKSREIKEMTVKSMEPEIQRLIAKHKAEIKRLQSMNQAEVLQADERASVRFVKQIENLREQLDQEKDAACERERQTAKERMEKQLAMEEQSYQQQRRRLYTEIQEEKERMAEQARRQRKELDQKLRDIQENQEKALEKLKIQYEATISEKERRHQNEVRDIDERLKIEKEAWEENYMKKQGVILAAKERELKEAVKRGRDQEIEMVINRLEEEAQKAREETERQAESRISRIREKYTIELKEAEKSERNTIEKFNELKDRNINLEGELTECKRLLAQREQYIIEIEEVKNKLSKERDNVTDIVRQEFADRLVVTEEENKSLKLEMNELRARCKLEVDRITKQKDEELDTVHTRVKQALARKEETLNSLRSQHQSAIKRADHLEMLLEAQRKQLLR